jgi:hypothetical protein
MKMNHDEKGEFRYETHDLWLAAYLLCEGGKIEDVVKLEGDNKMTFVIVGQVNLMPYATAFYSRRGRVDPKELKGRLSDLRDLLRLRSR